MDAQRVPPLPAGEPEGRPLLNSALVEAMRVLSHSDTPHTRALLHQVLLETSLVVAVPTGPDSPLRGASDLSVAAAADEFGPILPVFTTESAAADWLGPDAGVATAPARALLAAAAALGPARMLINLGSMVAVTISAAEVVALSRPAKPRPEPSRPEPPRPELLPPPHRAALPAATTGSTGSATGAASALGPEALRAVEPPPSSRAQATVAGSFAAGPMPGRTAPTSNATVPTAAPSGSERPVLPRRLPTPAAEPPAPAPEPEPESAAKPEPAPAPAPTPEPTPKPEPQHQPAYPRHLPTAELLDAVRGACAEDWRIDEAWLCEMRSDTAPARLCVALSLTADSLADTIDLRSPSAPPTPTPTQRVAQAAARRHAEAGQLIFRDADDGMLRLLAQGAGLRIYGQSQTH